MYEPEFSNYPWAAELAAAASTGPQQAKRFAKSVRGSLDDDDADAIGAELMQLFTEPEPSDLLGALASTAPVFAGPQTVGLAGELLRNTDDENQIELAFEVLQNNQLAPSAIQQLVCSREATNPDVRRRAASMFKFGRLAVRQLSVAAWADVDADVLQRYFAYALEIAMLEGVRYRAEDLEAACKSPASETLRRVVWAEYQGTKPTHMFIIDTEDSGFLDADAEPISLDPTGTVGVVHPSEMSQDQHESWGELMADFEIIGLFSQLDRVRESAQDNLPFDDIKCLVPSESLHAFLLSQGWAQTRFGLYELPLRGAMLQLHTYYVDEQTTRLEQLRLNRPKFKRQSTDDDVIYSEAVAAGEALLSRFHR